MSYQELPLKPLTHVLTYLYLWHIGLQCDGSQSNPCFLYSYRQISQKIRDNQPLIQQYLSPNERNTLNIYNIWNISQLLTVLLVETEANSKYLGLDTSITANFSNNTGYTLQLQASTQLTNAEISALDHSPSAIMTV